MNLKNQIKLQELLVGKIISHVYMGCADGYSPYAGNNAFFDAVLCFVMEDKSIFAIMCEADCCSESWVSDIIDFDNMIDAEIISVEILEDRQATEEENKRTRGLRDKIYGIKIFSMKGYTDIIFRNSSNGYYGSEITIQENFSLADLKDTEVITTDLQG